MNSSDHIDNIFALIESNRHDDNDTESETLQNSTHVVDQHVHIHSTCTCIGSGNHDPTKKYRHYRLPAHNAHVHAHGMDISREMKNDFDCSRKFDKFKCINTRNVSRNGRTVLQEACVQNNLTMVQSLIRGGNGNIGNSNRYTNTNTISNIRSRSSTSSTRRSRGKNIHSNSNGNGNSNTNNNNILDINKKSYVGEETALHYAVMANNTDIVHVLLKEGRADPNQGNKIGATPLHYVQSREMAELLRRFGADSTLTTKTTTTTTTSGDYNNLTPRQYIVGRGQSCGGGDDGGDDGGSGGGGGGHGQTATNETTVQSDEGGELFRYLVKAEEEDTKKAIQRNLENYRRSSCNGGDDINTCSGY